LGGGDDARGILSMTESSEILLSGQLIGIDSDTTPRSDLNISGCNRTFVFAKPWFGDFVTPLDQDPFAISKLCIGEKPDAHRGGDMEKLIEALQIFLKYGNPTFPTHCEHDVMYICGYNEKDISEEDTAKLKELGFFWGDETFQSFRYGSA
jgi:hypothetical protein